jgi:hypothetical protein
MRDESGQIVGMSTIVRDLTQAKKTQQLEEQFSRTLTTGMDFRRFSSLCHS